GARSTAPKPRTIVTTAPHGGAPSSQRPRRPPQGTDCDEVAGPPTPVVTKVRGPPPRNPAPSSQPPRARAHLRHKDRGGPLKGPTVTKLRDPRPPLSRRCAVHRPETPHHRHNRPAQGRTFVTKTAAAPSRDR